MDAFQSFVTFVAAICWFISFCALVGLMTALSHLADAVKLYFKTKTELLRSQPPTD